MSKISSNPTYISWRCMKARCLSSWHIAYPRYGGNGITICKSWRKFSNFLRDMGERPDGLTLERIDNNKGYSLDNCVWADRKAQANNRNGCLIPYTYGGRTQCLSDWAKEYGLPPTTFINRIIRSKWSFENAAHTPLYKKP